MAYEKSRNLLPSYMKLDGGYNVQLREESLVKRCTHLLFDHVQDTAYWRPRENGRQSLWLS